MPGFEGYFLDKGIQIFNNSTPGTFSMSYDHAYLHLLALCPSIIFLILY